LRLTCEEIESLNRPITGMQIEQIIPKFPNILDPKESSGELYLAFKEELTQILFKFFE
jgi:hypothetical protein